MIRVFSIAALMFFMNTATVMAASDIVSLNQQDITLRNGRTQIELIDGKHIGSDNIDSTKAGVRV